MKGSVEVTLYTRAECPLCEKAKRAMREAGQRHGIRFELVEVDIDYDLDLLRRFNEHVPVVYVGGREAFRHRVDPDEFAIVITRHAASDSGRRGDELG